MNDDAQKFTDHLFERLKDPLVVSLLIPFLIYNWDIVITVLDLTQSYAHRIKSVTDMWNDKENGKIGRTMWPFAACLFWYFFNSPLTTWRVNDYGIKYKPFVLNKWPLTKGKWNESKYFKDVLIYPFLLVACLVKGFPYCSIYVKKKCPILRSWAGHSLRTILNRPLFTGRGNFVSSADQVTRKEYNKRLDYANKLGIEVEKLLAAKDEIIDLLENINMMGKNTKSDWDIVFDIWKKQGADVFAYPNAINSLARRIEGNVGVANNVQNLLSKKTESLMEAHQNLKDIIV